MFNSASKFNRDVSRWNVENVVDFDSMFHGASAFDRTICGKQWSDNEWNFEITSTSHAITEKVGAVVTQGASKGTLKTAIQTKWTLAIINAPVIAETAGVTVTQGTGTPQTGTLKTTLSGGATSIVIETASGVMFVNSVDITIGTTTVVHANIQTATGLTFIIIHSAAGATFVTDKDLVIGSTTDSSCYLNNYDTPKCLCPVNSSPVGDGSACKSSTTDTTCILYGNLKSKWKQCVCRENQICLREKSSNTVQHATITKATNHNAFAHGNGRAGCCDIGSYMKKPDLSPFVKTDACAVCPVHLFKTTQTNSYPYCPSIQDLVKMWMNDETGTEKLYGHIKDWDTSEVLDMEEIVCGHTQCPNFNIAAKEFNADMYVSLVLYFVLSYFLHDH